MYCQAKQCRELVTSNGKGPFCRRHYLENIELVSREAVYFHGEGYGHSMCFLCFQPVEFRFGLMATHKTDNGQRCDGSGQEIAVLRKENQRW